MNAFDYIPCEGCECNNMRCELLCAGCKDWEDYLPEPETPDPRSDEDLKLFIKEE